MLSVMIITKNEEHNLDRCLRSVAFAEEIIVLDSGSSDRTLAIAQQYTHHVYQIKDWKGYGIQKQRALNHTTQPWVLNLDADESVSEALREEILKVITTDQYDACRVPIQLYFYEKPMRFCSPTRHLRLFKRNGAQFSEDVVHEKIILPDNLRIGRCRSPLLHHSFQDLSHAIDKMNRYSSCSAQIRFNEKQDSFVLSKAILSSVWMFLRCYFFQSGFLDGRLGFILAALSAQGAFFRGAKQIYLDR